MRWPSEAARRHKNYSDAVRVCEGYRRRIVEAERVGDGALAADLRGDLRRKGVVLHAEAARCTLGRALLRIEGRRAGREAG